MEGFFVLCVRVCACVRVCQDIALKDFELYLCDFTVSFKTDSMEE